MKSVMKWHDYNAF